MYKLQFSQLAQKIVSVLRVEDMTSIPFDPGNIDYQQFKSEVLAGASLQDADGNTLTPADAMTFVHGLPK